VAMNKAVDANQARSLAALKTSYGGGVSAVVSFMQKARIPGVLTGPIPRVGFLVGCFCLGRFDKVVATMLVEKTHEGHPCMRYTHDEWTM
jgi:hypothetical protein